LCLSTAKGIGRLAEFDVTEADVIKRLYLIANILLVFEEFESLFHSQVENVSDILSVVLNLEYLLFEALAVTALTLEEDIGHELHLDFYLPFALASVASTTFNIEREVRGFVAPRLREVLVGEKLTNDIVCLHITHGIRPR
jgi:hypothetical protein